LCYITDNAMKRTEIVQSISRFRKGLLKIIIAFILLGMIIFPFSKTLLLHLRDTNLRSDLVAFGIPEAFFSVFKLTLFASLFCSMPIILYQVWISLAPIFLSRGMKFGTWILLTAIFLFYLGALFCYFVTLPFGVRFLMGYQTTHIQPMISVGKYISFCAFFVFGFGLTFELPLVLALLSYLQVVNAAILTRNRRYAILLITILAAVVTPTPDVFNLSLMGGPLYILFEVGIILVKIIERKRLRVETSFSGGLR
jgi:sec-independent protein translocase protein TatC